MISPNFYSSKVNKNTKVRVGVALIIRDEAGRILLERRSDCGLWGLPGGRVEPGESISETAIREAKEETGLEVEVIRLLGVYSKAKDRIVEYPDAVIHLVDILLEAKIISGNLSLSEESFELKFFAPNNLPSDIVPPAMQPIRDAACDCIGVIS